MSCCKRIAGGVCEHDRQEASQRINLEAARIRHDMQRPGITDWEVKELEKKLKELPDPFKGTFCPACKMLLKDKESHERSHDGAFGEYTFYVCH